MLETFLKIFRYWVGIDVSKKYLDVCVRVGEKNAAQFRVPNSACGFEELSKRVRLARKEAGEVHFCMESTGGYELDVASFLCGRGETVSVVNPSRVKNYVRALGVQNKTDRADARSIAGYAQTFKPKAWHLSDPELLGICQLHRQRVRWMEEFQRVGNWLEHRKHRTEFEVRQQLAFRSYLELNMTQIEEEILRRLQGLPQALAQVEALMKLLGMGPVLAVALVCELGPVESYGSPQSYAAAVGLNPCRCESGNYRGKTRMSKAGNAWVRNAGWMPAGVAMRSNPPIQALVARLEEKGKEPKQIRVAALRKLLMQAYGVLKALSQGKEPFYPKKEEDQEGAPKAAPPKRLRFRICPSRLRARKDTFEAPANPTPPHRKKKPDPKEKSPKKLAGT